MALVTISATNQTGLPAPLTQLMAPNGLIPASSSVTLTDYNYVEEILRDTELLNYIQTNVLLLSVNSIPLTKEQSLAFLDAPTVPVKVSYAESSHGPGTTDDATQGYSVGSLWVTTDGIVYRCVDATPTNALWLRMISGSDSITELADVDTVGAAHGDILYFNGTNWTELPAGTQGELLTTQGAGTSPLWLPSQDAVRRFFSYSFTSSSGQPYIESSSTAAYETIGYFDWPGSVTVDTPTQLKAVVARSGGTSMNVRVYDTTNVTTIAELTGATATTFTPYSLGTLSNITTTEAVWEIQIQGVGPGVKARIAAFTGVY
jgi:hypothetical protein